MFARLQDLPDGGLLRAAMRCATLLTALGATWLGSSRAAHAQSVSEIPAPTVAMSSIDMDGVGRVGPTSLSALNAAALPVPARLAGITLTPSAAPLGFYDANAICHRALAMSAHSSGELVLIDPLACTAYLAFDGRIDLLGESTEIGIGIGDWTGAMVLDFYRGGVLQTNYTSTTYTTCARKYFRMSGGAFDRIDLRAGAAAGTWVFTESVSRNSSLVDAPRGPLASPA